MISAAPLFEFIAEALRPPLRRAAGLDDPLPAAPSVYARLRTLLLILLIAGMILFLLPQLAHGGGPGYVAGVSYFDPLVKGVPLTWSQGALNYYTDQGNLSSLLPQASADAFVADAFSRWTGISTVAISATQAGHLAEDVSGQNVVRNPDGSITMPADILPTATGTPVGIVYDYDGAVTDALLGSGAGGTGACFTNAVFGGDDNFSTDGHFLHALVILNGNCATTSTQLTDMKYRLVRVLGRVLGLDWSQANVNVFTNNPPWTLDDLNGLSIMHAVDETVCVPITICFATADQPKMDDRAAISRLYPVTTQNQSRFPGKQLFFENTIRIHGSVHFVDASGQAAQPMQGVNVVARWIDPNTGQPSRSSVATSVSGFLFRGNAGNPVNGYVDLLGQRYDRFGSDDSAVEGSFDVAGLEIPNGAASAQYELSVEPLDPIWSASLAPYGIPQITPSGATQPIVVTVSKGGDVQQDLLMSGSAHPPQDWFEPTDYSNPAPVPSSGEWAGTISGYGNTDYFRFTGQGSRTLSVELTALDEFGATSQNKLQSIIGMWALSDPPGTLASAHTPMPFNTLIFGLTQLNAVLNGTADFRIGITDDRGDGRPDYGYLARVFYGDHVTPARARVAGGTPVTVNGFGFRPGNTVTVSATSASVLALNSNEVTFTAPAMADGIQSVSLTDPATLANSVMTNVLTYGAGPTDNIRLLIGSNPATPVGVQAVNPVRVQATASDGVTPVAGASVVFSVTPAASLSACGGRTTCTVYTDESGIASTYVTVLTTGAMTITAALAPASYNPPKTVQASLLGTQSALDLGALYSYQFLAQGATLDIPLTARVLANGVPLKSRTVTYRIVTGSGTLNPTSPVTDNNGYATSTLHVTSVSSDVRVSVCVEPGDTPCQTYYLISVLSSALKLEPVSGSVQVVIGGQNFQPVTVRVVDSSAVPNYVRGASAVFSSILCRPQHDEPVRWVGDTVIGNHSAPVIVSTTENTATSDVEGLASFQPATLSAGMLVMGTTTAGPSSLPFQLDSVWQLGTGNISAAVNSRRAEGPERQLLRGTD